MALVDDVTIKVQAGNGGNGGHSFHTYYGDVKSHPDGGNGGAGGDIYFMGSTNKNDLSEFRYKKVIKSEDGQRGMNKDQNGKKGEDETVLVPLGTTLIDTATQEAIEILEKNVPVLVAHGGKGRSGNQIRELDTQRLLLIREEEQKGQTRELHLILNLIAEIGLIGFPNAGKSSLLKTLTNAVPKIGNYPFTTLEPNLGTLTKGSQTVVIADIPGLVEGASEGRGLGIQFLKHIQKTKILLHCIDATQIDPYKTYETVRSEFKEYDKTLLDKKEVILLTKIDLVEKDMLKEHIKALKKTKKEILTTSIYDDESIAHLKEKLIELTQTA